MKENKTWITIGIVFLVGMVTKRIWNGIGGVKSLPYWIQIIIAISIPITLSLVAKKERKKINDFQYKLLNVFIMFFIIIVSIIIIIIVLSNEFPTTWKQYRVVFEVILPATFLFFSVYMAILTIKNIKK